MRAHLCPCPEIVLCVIRCWVHESLNLWRTKWFSFGNYYVIVAALMAIIQWMSLYSHHYAHKIVTTAISIKFCRPQLSNSPLQDQDAEHPIFFFASEARRARRASLASQGEGAPVQCIGFWTSDISENMHFWHMVHRCHFCLFSPKYQRYIIKKSDPARPGPTRPDHDALCAPISRKVLKLRKIFISHQS